MAARVARRARRRKPAAVSRERRRAAQQRVRAALRAEVRQVVQAAVERALEAEVTALLGRAKHARRATAAPGRAARCARCGSDWRRRLWRAGSYRRTLRTAAATVRVRVPRVGCLCGGTVPLEFAAVGRYERSWGDLQERARQLAGLCLSLRDIREVLATADGRPIACSTLNGWIHQAGALAEALRAGPLERIPAVVMLDGLWVKRMAPTGETYTDTKGRRRQRVRRERAPLLVACGVDPASGERWLLDWELGREEDEASWRRLPERLHARGLRADAGLEVFVHDGASGLEAALDLVHFGPGVLRQRCVFHVLKSVREAVRGEPGMDRDAKRERRRAVLQDAAAIWATTDRAEIQRRRQAFRATWAEREPTAVATLERAFGQALAYLDALERARERGERWQARHLRATSVLERVNRSFRQKARQVGVFQADPGLVAAIGLVVAHRDLGPPPADDAADHEGWTEVLEAALLAR